MEKEKTVFTGLQDAIDLTFCGINYFHDLIYESADGELEKMLYILRQLLDKQQADLEEIYKAINRTLGRISLENPKYKEYVEFEGRTFEYPEIIRAVLEPVKPQAAAQEGFELDPLTKENIFKDAGKLQDMASQIQLTAESLCHDLGLELPPNIKERIAREKAARQAA